MIDSMRGLKFLPPLTILLLGLLALTALSLIVGGVTNKRRGDYLRHLSHLTALSQSIPQQAASAGLGDPLAFDALSGSRGELEQVLAEIEAGRSSFSLFSSLSARYLGESEAWSAVLADTDTVLGGRDAALIASEASRQVDELMPQLLGETATLAGSLGASRRGSVIRHLERFEMTGQRVQQDLLALTEGLGDVEATAQRLADGEDYLSQVVRGLSGDDDGLGIAPVTGNAAQRLSVVETLYGQVSNHVRQAISTSDTLVGVQMASRRLAERGRGLYTELRILAEQTGPGRPGWYASPFTSLLLVGASLLVLIAIASIYSSTANIRKAAEENARQNERNQQAILRLLDELGSLADGDLTVQATVTEDITGAIADSINYAIEALRELVTTINDTAIMVDAAARQTQATSNQLAKASGTQSKQITSATESIGQIASSIEEVSGNAERASDVARHSVDVAHKGGDAVRRTIEGMNTIRETIQDTSKRIKRLGESSQEIGNIVELINDIAEQTNILALNASIQASMAGEAGRGFAVVADEVQRLAERSANATKQIEVLVRTIQSDTNEAVVSMERSTTDVVGGALLAENAGAGLDEIEQVSNQIAMLVQNISSSARQLATAAGSISRNTNVLREISSQTTESTKATSASISNLAELATQLRRSVAGFTLPESVATETAVLTQKPAIADQKPKPQDVTKRVASGS